MSVRAWKRVITACVVLTILVLIILTVVSALRYGALEKDYKDIMMDESRVDLSQYGEIGEEQVANYIRWLGNMEPDSTIDYQREYSSLHVENDFIFEDRNDEKICYLTFDDGPDAENTAYILDVLKEHNAKATFFVVYKDYKEERALYKRIAEEGHTIGVHTASHNYNKIYASVEDYLDDFERCSEQIESVTGVKPEIFRFPGGSVNSYNAGIYQEIIAEMVRRGYTYYD